MASKIRQPNTSGLVPPPPPYTPFFPVGQAPLAQTPQGMQMMDAGIKAVPIQPVAIPDAVPNDFFNFPQSLVDARSESNRRMSELQTQLNQPAPAFQYSPPQQSQYQQGLQDQIRGAIMQNLGASNSFGNRFQKGFDMAQQLAANTIIPLTAGGGPSAMGALEATREINNQVRGRETGRTQEKAALNAALTNLASIYEKMDVNSAQNVSSLIKSQLEIHKSQRELERQRFMQQLEAEKQQQEAIKQQEQAYLDQRGKLADSRYKPTDFQIRQQGNQIQAGGQQLEADKANMGVAQDNRNFAQKQLTDNQNYSIARGQLGLGVENLGMRAQELGLSAENQEAMQQLSALGKLGTLMQQSGKTATAVGNLGQLQNPGYADVMNSVGFSGLLQNLAKQGNVQLPQAAEPQAVPVTQPAAPGYDLGGFLQGAANFGGRLFGIGGSAQKQQPQPQPIQVDPKIMANAASNDAARQQAVAQISAQLQANGEKVTPERVAEELNKLANGGKKRKVASAE